MQRGRQLLELGARLQQAGAATAASTGAASTAWAASVTRSVWHHAQHHQQQATPASLKAWAAGEAQAAAAAASSRQVAAAGAGRRSFAASTAVAGPGPAPRGTSKAGSGRSVWSGLFLLIPGGLAGFLGKWQWERREWKRELLERREAMMKGNPVDLFALEQEPAEYSRVVVEGEFDHGRSQFVGPRTRTVGGSAKQGYLLMTPLRQEGSGRAVVVNRGWVPAEWRDNAEMRKGGQPGGKVQVEGLLRRGEDPGKFVPPNEPDKGAWYYISPAELAAACGLPLGAPLVEVVTEEPGSYIGRGPPTPMDALSGRGHIPKVEEEYPLPKSMQDLMHFSVMPQDHLNYAATWWMLSAATLGLAVKAIRQGVRPR